MKLSRHSSVRIAALAAALAILVAACGSDSDGSSPTNTTTAQVEQGGSIVIGAEPEFTSFNTNTSADNTLWGAMIARLVWPQMYFQTPDFKLEPGFIADGRAEVVSEDPFTVRWKIKQEAVWSDGTPVTSDDLEYFWQSCNGQVDEGEPTDTEDGDEVTAVDCVATDGYDQITKFTKVDDKTVEAEFDSVVAEYESLFSTPMPPAHIAREEGPDAWATAFVDSPVVSAGPFNLKEYVKDESITLEANKQFFGEQPYLDEITFRFIEESSQQVDALRNEEVDLIYPQPQLDLTEQVGALPDIHSETNFGATWEHLTFNFKNKLLAQDAVRTAIAQGTDRAAIVDALMKPFSEEATVLDNRIFVNNSEAYQNNAGAFATRDLAAANKTLDDAGWVEGPDGIRVKDGQRLHLRIITTGGDALREDTEELIQNQFKEFGVEVEIDNRPGGDAFDVIFGFEDTAGQWDIALFAWVGTVTPAISSAPVYGTDQGNNPGAYSNKELDGLFDQAIAELDETTRNQLLNDADLLMWEGSELPDLPLYQKPTYLAYQDKYVNISDNTTSEGFTWNAEKWGIEST